MDISFEDKGLQELFEVGKTKEQKYKKYSRDERFKAKLSRQINTIKAIETFEGLYRVSFLHYEALRHEYSGYNSFRIGNEYVERIICKEHTDKIELIMIKIDDTHYGNKR